MTIKKDLKKHIRERQEKTGEAYTTARMHVLRQKEEKPMPRVQEMSLREVTALAEAAGLKAQAFLTPRFPERLARPALERLREVLLTTAEEGEPGTRLMRDVLLRGEPDVLDVRTVLQDWTQTRAFVRNLRLGIRGPSRTGRILPFDVQTESGVVTVVAALVPTAKKRPAKLLLGTREDYVNAEQALMNPASLLEPWTFPDAE